MDTKTIRATLEKHRFWVDNMTGDQNAGDRAAIMSAIRGAKVPKSASGINAVRVELTRLANADGCCLAARTEQISKWAQAL